jgi:hypothetical protein
MSRRWSVASALAGGALLAGGIALFVWPPDVPPEDEETAEPEPADTSSEPDEWRPRVLGDVPEGSNPRHERMMYGAVDVWCPYGNCPTLRSRAEQPKP